jgi:hypothetical protein
MEICFKVSAKLLAHRAKVRAAAAKRLEDRDAWLKRMEALNHGKLKTYPRYK